MSAINVQDPHGRETILSQSDDSPVAPYVREYHPRSLEDLQEIGLLPAAVELDHLRQARDDAVGAASEGRFYLVPPLSAEAQQSYPDVDHYTQAYNAQVARTSLTKSISSALIQRHGYTPKEADFLAKKTIMLEPDTYGNALLPVWRQIELADDLLVRSPARVANSIDGILARDVIIFNNGTLTVDGSYLLIRCRNLGGESQYWKTHVRLDRRVSVGRGA